MSVLKDCFSIPFKTTNLDRTRNNASFSAIIEKTRARTCYHLEKKKQNDFAAHRKAHLSPPTNTAFT